MTTGPGDEPRVTVFIPAFDAEAYIAESIRSVLDQTYQNFELLIIDDGSRDATRDIVERFARDDARIHLVSRENRGRPATRNEGFERSRGEYVALLDADDICLPGRLARQVAYLDSNPDCGAVGTAVREIGGRKRVVLYPGNSEDIEVALCFGSALANPSAMVRRSVVRAHGIVYRESDPLAQDYRFWTEMARITRLANLPEIHLVYRVHTQQGTTLNPDMACRIGNDIAREHLARLGVPVDVEDITYLRYGTNVRAGIQEASLSGLVRARNVLLAVAAQMRDAGGIDSRIICNVFLRRMVDYGSLHGVSSMTVMASYIVSSCALFPLTDNLAAVAAFPARLATRSRADRTSRAEYRTSRAESLG